MTKSPAQVKSLTEEIIRVASQQYDVALMHHASLPRQELYEIDSSAFLRCQCLQLLDLSRNKLSTLGGLEPVAAQLTFLNVSENHLSNISALEKCTALQYCYLEGNELASVESLRVLVSLPRLAELVLQRSEPLAETDPQETLLLDNPVCRNTEMYQNGFLKLVPHIRWVDGVPSFMRSKLLCQREGNGDNETDQGTSNETLLSSAAAAREIALEKMMDNSVEENKLRKLLAVAAEKCEKACHA